MSIGKFIGRIATVVGCFALYALAQTVAVLPTMIGGGKTSATVIAVVFGISFGGLIYLLASIYRYFLRSERPQLYGPLRPTRKTWRFMLLMVVLLVAIQVVASIATSTHAIPESNNQESIMTSMQQAPLAMALVAVIGAPPVEELLFRGLLMHSFPHQDQKQWVWVSGIVSAAVFGLLHSGFKDPANWLVYSALGGVFVLTYAKTKDIRYSMALHFLNNFAALFL
ncbi:CPBP family intramembrane glutamic endopeptidase [Lacticaseibacillus jixiensis]|uniref:CPBP family intramembrane glutamic endopeptidase n=1 Tax=Lacticaseibacillus jixiensis TaxID=3231926 RepID=UPI0036F19719